MSAQKQLYKIPEQGFISGVLAGIAQYLEIDIALTRLLFVIFVFLSGIFPGVIIYIIAAIVMPTKEALDSNQTVKEDNDNTTQKAETVSDDAEARIEVRESTVAARKVFGWGIIAIGGWYLLSELFPAIAGPAWSTIWPIALIALGIYVITRPR